MYKSKPYDKDCGYSELTHNLIERMCKNVEREDFVLDKKTSEELILKTYDLFDLPRPKKVVWCKDIFENKFQDVGSQEKNNYARKYDKRKEKRKNAI